MKSVVHDKGVYVNVSLHEILKPMVKYLQVSVLTVRKGWHPSEFKTVYLYIYIGFLLKYGKTASVCP